MDITLKCHLTTEVWYLDLNNIYFEGYKRKKNREDKVDELDWRLSKKAFNTFTLSFFHLLEKNILKRSIEG